MHSKQGLTIIELLIVTIVIGILASVLFPNLLDARRSAADTALTAYSRNSLNAVEIYMLNPTHNVSDLDGVTCDSIPGEPNPFPDAVVACTLFDDGGVIRLEGTGLTGSTVSINAAGINYTKAW